MTAAETAVMSTPSLYVALITETFAPEINGVANTLDRLVDGLRERGHRLQLVRPRQATDQERKSDEHLILTRGWPLPGYAGLQWGQSARHKLLSRWRKNRPDVLYIATEGPLGWSALQAARRLKIPVVSGFHTNFQQYTGHYGAGVLTRLVTNYLRWFHNRTALTLAPSMGQVGELERRGFAHVELLSRGVDSQLFHPAKRSSAIRQSWGLSENDIAVIHVGRLAAEKNLMLLIESFKALRQRYPQRTLKLILVGDGPQKSQLQAQLPDAIFCGVLRGEQLAEHYASGDVFLFPSLSETFGNVVLEALASGLGVVAYDQAAATQHIRNGHNGALAVPQDAQGFIEAACWLLEEPESLRRVRLNARQHAARQGWAAIIDQFEQHLRGSLKPVLDLPTERLIH